MRAVRGPPPLSLSLTPPGVRVVAAGGGGGRSGGGGGGSGGGGGGSLAPHPSLKSPRATRSNNLYLLFLLFSFFFSPLFIYFFIYIFCSLFFLSLSLSLFNLIGLFIYLLLL